MATKTLKALELATLLKVYPKEFKSPNGAADPTKIALRTTGGNFGQKMLTAFVEYVMKAVPTPAAVPLTILGYKHEPNGIVLGKAYNWVFFDKDSLEALTIEVDEADKLVFPPEPAMPKKPAATLTVIDGIAGSVEEEEDAAEQLKTYFLKHGDVVKMAKLYEEFVAEQGLVAAFAEFVQDATDFVYEVESDDDEDDGEEVVEDEEALDDDENEEEEDDGEGAE